MTLKPTIPNVTHRDDGSKQIKGPRGTRFLWKKINPKHETMCTSRYITEKNASVYRKNKVLTKETGRKRSLKKIIRALDKVYNISLKRVSQEEADES